jgi:hypothetical protein
MSRAEALKVSATENAKVSDWVFAHELRKKRPRSLDTGIQDRLLLESGLSISKGMEHLWPKLCDVRLDGRSGVASFVELKRRDDSLDYGYLAVVRGDPDAKRDTPDLMLHVIRDGKNALAKGKQPIGKEEFLKLGPINTTAIHRR